jgi:DNA-binding response OmpR family regulator
MTTRHVLIVDDDSVVRTMLERLLRLEGFQVSVANDGDEALKQCETQSPDLVLLDYNLPGRNGLEVLRELRRRCPKLKVIMLSGTGDLTVEERAVSLGANYLPKPPDLARLLTWLKL